MLWYIYGLFGMLIALSQGYSYDMQKITDRLFWGNRHEDVRVLGKALVEYQSKYRRYPADLDELMEDPIFISVRPHVRPDIRYVRTTGLRGANFFFDRAVVYAPRGDREKRDDATIRNSNECGTGGLSTALEWCPGGDVLYASVDNRLAISQRITEDTNQLKETLIKFISTYQGSFPDLGGAMTPGSSAMVKDLVGFPGVASNCTGGSYVFYGMAFECRDLFGSEGFPVVYNFINKKQILLTLRTTVKKPDGSPYYITQDIKL